MPSSLLLFAALPALSADHYVDPVKGSPAGDGSAANPWRTLQEVIEAGLIETREWDAYPYEAGVSVLVPKDAGAPVKAGDTLWLRSGYHGDLFIQRAYNAKPVTLAAEAGQAPTAARIQIQAGANWVIRGLSFSPTHAGAADTRTLVHLEDHSWSGPVHDIEVVDNDMFSIDDSSAWSADDWNDLAANGISAAGTRIHLRDNRLLNVNFGISVTATDSWVEGNEVTNFSGDGLRGLGDHTTFQSNTVRNCYAVNANHDDGFQSWSTDAGGQVGAGEVTGIVLRGNVFVNYTDPKQPHRGTLQGIGCFDGMFVDWVVENNVVVTDHWHGITLLGARNARIVNNTVIDPNDVSPGPPWISLDPHKDGRHSDGVVRNNLVTDLNIDGAQAGVIADHNLELTDPNDHFEDAAGRDLRLRQTSPAVDAGSPDLAPATDILGVDRPQGAGVDLGAYERPVDCADAGGSCCAEGQACGGSWLPAGDCPDLCCDAACEDPPPTDTDGAPDDDGGDPPGDDDDDDGAGDGGTGEVAGDAKGGCGCASGGGSAILAWWLLAAVASMRRTTVHRGRLDHLSAQA